VSIAALDKVTLVGHLRDKDAVLTGLQELGCLHLIPLTREGEAATDGGPSREAREALRFLASTPQRRRQVTDPRRFDAVEVQRQALGLQRRFHELRNERDFLATRIQNLAPWGEFEFPPLETLGGQRLWFFQVPHAQMKAVAATELRWEVVEKDQRFYYVVVISEKEPQNMPVARVHTGARSRRELVGRLEEVEMELEDVEAERSSLTRWCMLLGRALDGLEDRAARAQAAAQTAVADPIYALRAWIPRDRIGELRMYARRQRLALELSKPAPSDAPPTLLRNAAPLRAGEDLVAFYQTPSYWLWDPSSVVFVSFAVFFAMILADAGYALLLAGIVLLYWRKMGASDSGRRWRILLGVLAGTTAVYGALAGSYFGVSPPPGTVLAHLHVLDLADFSVMMGLSIVIGAAHVSYANVRDALRYPRWPQRLPSLGWAAVILGGLGAWGGTQLASQTLVHGGAGLFGSGLLLVVGFSGYGEKPLMRVVKGISALTGLSGAFGDVLSYLRLFALGLASASLAIAFNDMAREVRDAVPGVGFLFGLLVLLLGHALNFLLSVSSGFIHGLRLNVIEFFKWGVQDEGTPYRPFERKETGPWTTSY
jgi:V/A-type H+-transporting ATPase subunit I